MLKVSQNLNLTHKITLKRNYSKEKNEENNN